VVRIPFAELVYYAELKIVVWQKKRNRKKPIVSYYIGIYHTPRVGSRVLTIILEAIIDVYIIQA